MNLDELVQNTNAVNNPNQGQAPQVNSQGAQVPQATVPQQAAATPPPVQNIPVNNPVNTNSIPQQNPVQAQAVPQNLGGNPYAVPQTQTVPQNINVNIGRDDRVEVDTGKKCPKVNGFFRILTLLALLASGGLMLLEVLGVFSLNFNGFEMSMVYPIVVILSVVVLFYYKGFLAKLVGSLLFVGVVGGLTGIGIYNTLSPETPNLFDDNFAYDMQFPQDALIETYSYFGDYTIAGKDSDYLIVGNYQSDRDFLTETGFTDDAEAYIKFKEDFKYNVLQRLKSNLIMGISSEKKIDLYMKNFIGNYFVDLNNINWASAKLHGGLTNFVVNVGDDFESEAVLEITSVGSNIEINVPENIGVRLYYDKIAGSMQLTNFDVSENEKNYYESLNIKDAKKIINIDVDSAVAKFVLNWIE